MKSARDISGFLRDIAEHSDKARRFIEGVDFEAFQENEEKTFAVVRALEVIGEAARGIPPSFRKRHPEISWEDIAGMRSKLIHDYFGIDLEVVWRTVQFDLPILGDQIRAILKDSSLE